TVEIALLILLANAVMGVIGVALGGEVTENFGLFALIRLRYVLVVGVDTLEAIADRILSGAALGEIAQPAQRNHAVAGVVEHTGARVETVGDVEIRQQFLAVLFLIVEDGRVWVGDQIAGDRVVFVLDEIRHRLGGLSLEIKVGIGHQVLGPV